MCGIAGIVGGWPDARATVERMLSSLRHRGPDGAAVHHVRGAVLGHQRLSIIDLDGGRQPIGNEDGTKWIVCNGEIYNYRELTEELLALGHQFATRSDTEVILHLYEQYGEACLGRLRGMFAFAIWDEVAGSLFLARDHLGQKPLFYTQRGDKLAFASEIKALLTLLPGAPAANLDALHQYLSLRVIAPPLTMFEGIAKLAPGHCLAYSPRQGMRIRRYWDLDYEPKHGGSEQELLEELERQLIEAVRLHMVSDVPVGGFLSGGLDSTLVVALARTHAARGPMPTFTMGLAYGEYDEAPAARLVAERYGTDHHEEVVVPSLIDHLGDLVHYLDEPSDPLSICSYLVSRMASRHVKVVLGGDGGDELFGGYDRYYGNVYAGYYAARAGPDPARDREAPAALPAGRALVQEQGASAQMAARARRSSPAGSGMPAAWATSMCAPTSATVCSGRRWPGPPRALTPMPPFGAPTTRPGRSIPSTACSTPTAASGCRTIR